MRDLGVSDVAGKSDAKVFKSRHMSSPYGVVEGPKSKPVHLGMLETNKGIGPCGSCNPHLKERGGLIQTQMAFSQSKNTNYIWQLG